MMRFCSLALALLASAAVAVVAVSADLISIPIRKVPDEKHHANVILTHKPPRLAAVKSSPFALGVTAMRRKLHRGGAPHPEENIVLRDLANAQYYGRLKVGTPPRAFDVMFDTGSADLWVPGLVCTTDSSNCAAKNPYIVSASTSYSEVAAGAKTVFHIVYGSGDVHGRFGLDTVTIGEDYTVEHQKFAVVDSTDGLGKVYENAEFDGVLGLAFDSLSSMGGGAKSFFANLKDQTEVNKTMFAFFLGDHADGELTIGGYNKDRMQTPEEIHWIPLEVPAYWLINMDHVKFGNINVTEGSAGGIMDTGTSLIYGPYTEVNLIADSINATYMEQFGLFNIPCNATIPDLEFGMGGRAYKVPGNKLKMVFRDNDQQHCFLAISVMQLSEDSEIKTMDTELEQGVIDEIKNLAGDAGLSPIPFEYKFNTWLLGDIFLRIEYCIFDYDNERFGLAKLKEDLKR